MAAEFLSQDEVDALLRGVSGEAEEPQAVEETGGIRSYNLATQERIVRGRMPTLETIHERFARNLRIGLFNFMRRSPEVAVGQIRTLKYSEFVRNVVVPTNLNIVRLAPLRGNALFVLEPRLVFTIIDNLFGGDGRFQTHVEGRDFTTTEHRIIQRLLQVVFENLERAWAPVHPLKFEFVRSELHTQFASVATPSEIVVATSFNIELGSGGGDFHLCIPYASIEPIRDTLCSSMQGDASEPDRRWVRMLSRQVQSAEVEMVATLGHSDISVGHLLNMKVGDVVMIDIPDTVVATVDNVPVFDCKFGTLNGQYAIKVNHILTVPQRDNILEDDHG
ncbi:MAG: flagellar motor switch protein FliM [Betaproteobacteria bacterium]|nr:flagellar motor switch protein FliM [Betaproteobacteria bacterium]